MNAPISITIADRLYGLMREGTFDFKDATAHFADPYGHMRDYEWVFLYQIHFKTGPENQYVGFRSKHSAYGYAQNFKSAGRPWAVYRLLL